MLIYYYNTLLDLNYIRLELLSTEQGKCYSDENEKTHEVSLHGGRCCCHVGAHFMWLQKDFINSSLETTEYTDTSATLVPPFTVFSDWWIQGHTTQGKINAKCFLILITS